MMLGLFALACIFPVALIAGGVIWHDYQRERSQLIENTIATSRSMTSQIDQLFSGVETSLSILQTSPSLFDTDRSKFYAQAKSVLDTQLGRNILLSTVDGEQLINTLRVFGSPMPRYGNLAQIRKLRITHAPVVSDLFSGATDKKLIVSVAIPVIRDGQHIYNLSTGLTPAIFSNLLAQQGLPSEWVAAIVDSSGRIVARTRDNDKFLGTRVSVDLLNGLLKRSEGYVNGKTLDGIGVVAGYSQSQVTGWTTVIAIPVHILTRDLERQLIALALATAVILLLGLGLAMLLAGRIIRANRGLIAPALSLGEGKPIHIAKFGLREADEVGEALMKASKMLMATKHQANHDNLTALPNRGLFYEVVSRQMRISARNKTTLSVLFIDLDGFKKINDQFGHAAGDEILRQVAARIIEQLRASDTPSRLGGDEFAVALPDTNQQQAVYVAEKLVQGLSAPYTVKAQQMTVSASIGVAASGQYFASVETLVRAADDAMYSAKAAGKSRVHASTAHAKLIHENNY